MVDHLFIAEKPSLAREIAEARGEELGTKPQRSNGFIKVGDDAVTWLFGHMYETAPPEQYSAKYKSWTIEHLPIVPDKWKLVPQARTKDHLKCIKGLLDKARYVVNAGDAGREGQLLVDEVLIENGWDPFSENTKRLWVRSVARKDLLDALRSMLLNSDKKTLYESALCRQRADWILGMNTTRLFTVLARRSGANLLVSAGRVQTPTLKLVVDRDLEIKHFKAVDHYLPQVTFRHDNGSFQANWVIPADCDGLDSEGRLIDRSVAEKIAAKVDGKTGRVEDYKAESKSKAAPLPYSLSALQTECSSRFGMSAQRTLEIAQSLYDEHKVTTYPRSDNRYLPMSIYKDEAPTVLRNLASGGELAKIASEADGSLRSQAWNDSKVGEHHAIIPTVEATPDKIARLPDTHSKVFMVIAKSFLAQFYPAMRYKAMSATVVCEEERFKASGRKVVDHGWRRVYGAEPDDDEKDEDTSQSLPEMSKGDSVDASGTKVKAKRTTPPPRFTDGTLIQAMTQIHRFVTSADIKKRLKENDGIGTEATRANIIETLIKRKYLQRKGKYLVSTDMGQSIISVLPEDVTDPGLTAIWENYLERIIKGELSAERFMEGQIDALRKRIEAHKGSTIKIKGAPVVTPLDGHGETCDACGKGTMLTREIRKGEHRGKKFLACSAWSKDDPDACRNVKWPERKIDPLEGHGSECPKCGKGTLVTRQIARGEHKGKRFLSCDNWKKDDPTSCSHVVWPDSGKKVKPLPGDGDSCPKCGKGKMATREIRKGDNKGKRFLACDNWRKDDPSSCSHAIFPEDKVEKLPGDGESCAQCKEGRMMTRMIRKGDRKGQRFLSCSRFPECKHSINAEGGSAKQKASGPLRKRESA